MGEEIDLDDGLVRRAKARRPDRSLSGRRYRFADDHKWRLLDYSVPGYPCIYIVKEWVERFLARSTETPRIEDRFWWL